MHGYFKAALVLFAAALISPSLCGRGLALGDLWTSGGPCPFGSVAPGQTVTCNFGLTPEQLREVANAAVAGASGPLMHRIESLSKRLGVTDEATKTLLRIVGEQTDIPDERLEETLTKIATDYKRLQEQVAGASGPLVDRIESLRKRLGVTDEATKALLRIVGEQTDIPDERLAETLTKIATDYKRLQ